LVFYPFSYAAFFLCTIIAFSANLLLTYGGGKTWYINTENPDYIRPFYENENGRKVVLEFDYETANGKADSAKFIIKSNGNSKRFDTIQDAVSDPTNKNIVDYLEKCTHITSIEKNYDSLSEILILVALGSLKNFQTTSQASQYDSVSEILLKSEISIADKFVFIATLLKEASHDIVFTDGFRNFGIRTHNSKEDSPFIFDFETKKYYHFSYSEKKNAFELTKPSEEIETNWMKI
jgi:hypothetical protein